MFDKPIAVPSLITGLGGRIAPNLWDVVAFALITAVLVAIAEGARGISAPLPAADATISLDAVHLPYYAMRTTLRMFAALALSFLFTLTYATVAAKSRRAEVVLIPMLDVLQSVPILGFLSFTVTFFLGLFPGSTLGAECAAIFAIFTSQAWNMAFSFYQSLRTVPGDLNEVTRGFNLGLAALLVPRGAVRRAGAAVEHDDVDVRRLVLRRRVRSHLSWPHHHQAAWHRLLSGGSHRAEEHRRRLRGGADHARRDPALRPVPVPPHRRLGGQIPRRVVGRSRRRRKAGC